MALRNAIQINIADQLANFVEFDEAPRFHTREDPFELPESQFVKIFRLQNETTMRLVNIVKENSDEPSRSSALNAKVQVLTALHFYASGSYQTCIGKNIHMAISQASVSRSVKNVTNILNLPAVFNEWVSFPRNVEDLQELRAKFWTKHQFPGAIGCIDCTHVAIVAPPKDDENYPEHIYVNRKGYHSINVQLICDSDLKILNVNARYPGSTHDSYVWNNSNIFPLMQNICNRGHRFFLLGDNFVHRLLQNKADGKLVPSEGPPSESEASEEKLDSVQLEFTHLLTSQLEEQRLYFEDKLILLDSQLSHETKHLRDTIATLSDENQQLRSKLTSVTKEKQSLEKKLQQHNSKLTSTLNDLNEERQLGKALRHNQQQWQTKITNLEEKFNEIKAVKEKEIGELKEQVRDLMFFIDAQRVIEKSENREEIVDGSVSIAETPQTSSRSRKGRKKR